MVKALPAEKSLTLAKQAVKKQDWLTAQRHYKSVLDRFPGNKKAAKALQDVRQACAQGLIEAANEAQKAEDWRHAAACFRGAAYLLPNNASIKEALVKASIEALEFDQALKVIDQTLAEQADNVTYLIYRGKALHGLNKSVPARQALEKALQLVPGDPQALASLALVEQAQGNLDKALQCLEDGLKTSPWDVALLRSLAMLKPDFTSDDPYIDQARQALAKLGKDTEQGAHVQFALFDMLHKAGAHDAAFPYLRQGNETLACLHPFDFKSEAYVGALSKAHFQTAQPEQPLGTPPKFIFVTGLPRTGTTLVERILARSENVQAAGELHIVSSAVLAQLRDLRGRPDQKLKPSDIAAIRQKFLEGFDQISDGRAVIVDKMPANFRWIGHICAALPEARIVHMNRDPQAVAWSLYRHVFQGRGQDYVFTPQDIAKYMIFHKDLMTHWRKTYPGRIFDLNYSDLVQYQTASTKALAKAVGLEWSEAWLSPEKAETHVRTSSAVQVTKPIYQGSDRSWTAYETQLASLQSALKAGKLI